MDPVREQDITASAHQWERREIWFPGGMNEFDYSYFHYIYGYGQEINLLFESRRLNLHILHFSFAWHHSKQVTYLSSKKRRLGHDLLKKTTGILQYFQVTKIHRNKNHLVDLKFDYGEKPVILIRHEGTKTTLLYYTEKIKQVIILGSYRQV